MKTRIKELRQRKKLSQTQLAVRIGCSQNTISRIELEKTVPTAEILKEISGFFNVSIDYLLCLTEVENIAMPANTSFSPRIVKYTRKMQLLSDSDKDTIFILIDHLSDTQHNRR